MKNKIIVLEREALAAEYFASGLVCVEQAKYSGASVFVFLTKSEVEKILKGFKDEN